VSVVGGEYLREQDADAEHEGHGDDDYGECTIFGFGVARLAMAVEDVDERDGGYSADEEVVDHVGEIEGGVVGVGNVAGSEDVGDVLGSHQAEQAGERR